MISSVHPNKSRNIGQINVCQKARGPGRLLPISDLGAGSGHIAEVANVPVRVYGTATAHAGTTMATQCEIKSGVTTLGPSYFEEHEIAMKKLTGVTIPDTVTSIEKGTFEQCVLLTSVALPDSVVNMGEDVFSGCTRLKVVRFSTGMTRIPARTFACCRSLSTVSHLDNIKAIETSAFLLCASLATLAFGTCLTDIAKNAFAGCTELTAFVVPAACNIQPSAFQGCPCKEDMCTQCVVTSLPLVDDALQ